MTWRVWSDPVFDQKHYVTVLWGNDIWPVKRAHSSHFKSLVMLNWKYKISWSHLFQTWLFFRALFLIRTWWPSPNVQYKFHIVPVCWICWVNREVSDFLCSSKFLGIGSLKFHFRSFETVTASNIFLVWGLYFQFKSNSQVLISIIYFNVQVLVEIDW